MRLKTIQKLSNSMQFYVYPPTNCNSRFTLKNISDKQIWKTIFFLHIYNLSPASYSFGSVSGKISVWLNFSKFISFFWKYFSQIIIFLLILTEILTNWNFSRHLSTPIYSICLAFIMTAYLPIDVLICRSLLIFFAQCAKGGEKIAENEIEERKIKVICYYIVTVESGYYILYWRRSRLWKYLMILRLILFCSKTFFSLPFKIAKHSFAEYQRIPSDKSLFSVLTHAF